jgi:hypothetical protein
LGHKLFTLDPPAYADQTQMIDLIHWGQPIASALPPAIAAPAALR